MQFQSFFHCLLQFQCLYHNQSIASWSNVNLFPGSVSSMSSSSSSGSGSVLHYPHSGKEPCECSIHCLESPFQRERLRQVTVSLKLLSRNDLNHSLHLAGKASHLAKANFKGQEIVSTDLKETHRYLQNNINNYCKVHSQSEDGTIFYGCMISTKKHDPSWDLSFQTHIYFFVEN